MADPWAVQSVEPVRKGADPWAVASVQPVKATPQSRARADAERRAANTPGLVRSINNGFLFNAMGSIDATGAAAETGVHNALARATGQPDSGYGMREAYEAVRQAEGQAAQRFAREHPVQNLAGNVVGAVANPVNKLGARYVAGAPNLLAATGRAAGSGTAIGALYGAGGTQPGQNTLQQAGEGAFVGGLTGGASPVAGKVAGRAAGAVARVVKPSPKVDANAVAESLRAAKTAAYKAVDDMGIAYKPEAAQTLAEGIKDELTAANVSATRHPKAYSMMQDIQTRLSSGKPVSMAELDQLRQEVRRDVASPKHGEAEAFFGDKIIHNIDEFIDAAKPEQMANGDGPAAAAAIRKARDLNSRYRKIDTIAKTTESADLKAAASGSGGNINNATRGNLRPFIDPTSGKRIRNLTPDEAALMRQTVKGTPVQNGLRQVGKLSPEGNGLMMTANVLGGLASHGATVPIGVAGFIAKHISDRQTQANVGRLITLMANGGEAAGPAQAEFTTLAQRNPQVAALYRELMAALSSTAPSVAVSVKNQASQGASQ
jgi:hypothetical protein